MTDKEREDLAYLRHYFAQKDVIGSDPPDHTRSARSGPKSLHAENHGLA